MTRVGVLGPMAAILLALSASSGAAQTFDTFLLVPGVTGGSQDAKHKGWIDVISLSQTLNQGDPKKSLAVCSLSALKVLDIAGPALWAAAASGQVFADVAIEVQKTSAVPVVFYTIHLANARITSVQTKVDSDTFPVEQVVIAPQSATLEFRTQNSDGTSGTPSTSTVTCIP